LACSRKNQEDDGMTFCGTFRNREEAGFLTLALHCIALYDPLLKIEDGRYEKEKRGQLELFPLTTNQRKDFAKFVKTLRYFLDVYRRETIKTKPKLKDPWSFIDKTRGLDYCDYVFYDFWFSFIRSFKNDFEFEQRVNMLDSIAQGVRLGTYESTIKFLSKLNSIALYRHHSYSRGCF